MGSPTAPDPQVSPVLRFSQAPRPLQVWLIVAESAAVLIPLLVMPGPDRSAPFDASRPIVALIISALLILGSVLSVELGRVLEGRALVGNRAHKGLSAWTLTAVMLVPPVWWLVVVVTIYAHTWWRGMRLPVWKWTSSAAFVLLSACVADVLLRAGGQHVRLTDGLVGVLLVIAAAVSFLIAEVGLLAFSLSLSRDGDERWLAKTLKDFVFYATEGAVLILGAITGLIALTAPWFLLLFVAPWGLMQQAALQRPLQERAAIDAKTGLLQYESWRQLAIVEAARLTATGHGWAILFVDLDRFKDFNDRHGHLVGDHALITLAGSLTASIHDGDLVCRFGGEEFCVFLRHVDEQQAVVVADRIRESVRGDAASDLPALLTVSVGVCVGRPGPSPAAALVEGVLIADHAMYRAKADGRDRTRVG